MWRDFFELCCIFYFCNILYSFQKKMHVSEINVLFCMLNEFFCQDEFIFIHWVEKLNVWCNSSIRAWFWYCSWCHLWMIWRRERIWSSRCCRWDNIHDRCYALLNYLWHHFSNDCLNHFLHVLIDSIWMLIRHFDFTEWREDYWVRRFFVIRKRFWITIFQLLQYDLRNFVSSSFR